MGFKDNLKAELEYSGMLIKELAVRSGVNRRTIDNYLSTHKCLPSAESAVKIAQTLGVSVEYLVTGQESKGKQSERTMKPDIRALVQAAEQLNEEDCKIVLKSALCLIESLKNRGGGSATTHGSGDKPREHPAAAPGIRV
jgi:transcriptional regulator with XRE-family HTH domain